MENTEISPLEVRDGDFPDTDENWEVTERSKRLKRAVKAAGGNQAVATRARMHLGTLNRYISGRDMKASAMIDLARACGVSLDWLATGADSPSRAAPPKPAEPDRGLFASVQIDKLTDCMKAAKSVLARRGIKADMRHLVQVAVLLYDAVDPPEESSFEIASSTHPTEKE